MWFNCSYTKTHLCTCGKSSLNYIFLADLIKPVCLQAKICHTLQLILPSEAEGEGLLK